MEDEQFEDDFVVASGSPDFRSELAAQLAELAPEVIADGKVDVAKLQELLGEDVADSAERFGLFWPGKKNALRVAQAPTTATLRPDIENSKDWDTTQNVFIEGDNLEVLKILQKHYHNKIKMIYIDPPYNTGKDFVYPDNFKEGLDSYLEWTRQVNEEGKKLSSNSETEGRYHSNWLNMMYPRLKLARNLLTDDGVIFISIGDAEQDNLRKLCNEIFGERNFIAQISLITGANQSGEGVLIQKNVEYVLVFARDELKAKINRVDVVQESLRSLADAPSPLSTRLEMGYTVYWNPNNGDFQTKYDYDKNLIHTNDESKVYTNDSDLIGLGYLPIRPGKRNGQLHRWRWGAETFIERKQEIVVKEVNGKHSLFFRQAGMLPPKNVQTFGGGAADLKKLFGESTLFDYPKGVGFLTYISSIGSSTGDIVLDFFAGSATTAHALMKLNAEDGGNRKFVMVQLPEPTPEDSEARKAGYETIADISRERIRRAGAAILAEREGQLDSGEKPLDVGFRSYKLNPSNFAKWQVTSDVEAGKLGEHLLSLRGSADDDATPDDLLTEVLLKQGYSLTEQISKVDIAGLEIHSVGDGLVLAYLNEHVKPTLEQFREVVDSGPSRLIVLEDAYQGDDQLKTNLEQLCKSKSIELWRA